MNIPLILAAACLGWIPSSEDPATVVSPDGLVRVEVSVVRDGAAAIPEFRVLFHGKEVVRPSRLGVDLADGASLGLASKIEAVETRSFRENYRQFPGKRADVLNAGNEAVISLREGAKVWQVVVRAYDNGAAVRYRFPKQDGWDRLELKAERTEIRLADEAISYALPLKDFRTSHEGRYTTGPVAALSKDTLFAMPLLVEIPGTAWAAVAEADLTDYAGAYLARQPMPRGGLAIRLSPLPKEPNVAVRAPMPHDSPWRAVMIADRPERLIESDLILNLNKPSVIADTSWIKPGKTTFPWWNGFFEKDVPFKMGLNTETAKHYIDFCAEAGIPYHSLDGVDNIAWYGGTILPYQGTDITKGIDGLDLQEVLRYAAVKGVKIRLWMHWEAAQKHMARAFPLFREWGIEGVMLDFMDRDDQEMVNFLRLAMQTAADNHLTITLHGVAAPTGLERTFPNLLTHEGVMNLEHDKWDPLGVPPEHDLTVAFTRMLAGPLDYHQGSLRGVPLEKFQARNEAPLIIGTPCRTLASYVVFQNHLAMVADYPSSYRGHPALPILAKIPSSWDETKCLSGEVGKSLVIARKSGDDWWVGGMTDRNARVFEVPLAFLGEGNFRAEIVQDDLESPSRIKTSSREVRATETLRIPAAPSGGILVHLTRLPKP